MLRCPDTNIFLPDLQIACCHTMKPPPIKAILFDLDETLWPLLPVLEHAETTLYDWLAIHLPGITRQFSNTELSALRTELRPTNPRFAYDLWALRHATLTHAYRLGSKTSNEINIKICNEASDEINSEISTTDKLLINQAMQIFSTARNAVTPFDDVLPGLANLQSNFMIGSVSNGFADLHAIGIAHHFKVSLAAHQFGCAKPDPRIFHAACAALSVAPHEVLYVGDDPWLDIQGAQDAGLHAAWMNRFQRELPAYIVPTTTVTTLHELHAWLQH